MIIYKRGQGTCSFKCCDEEGISAGSPYTQMRPAKIVFSIQLLKIQEPCPPFQRVSPDGQHTVKAAEAILE